LFQKIVFGVKKGLQFEYSKNIFAKSQGYLKKYNITLNDEILPNFGEKRKKKL